MLFSPRTWGWSAAASGSDGASDVFPTHVGMVRGSPVSGMSPCRFPHARGDGPRLRVMAAEQETFSPRTWGWSGLYGG